MSLTAKPTYRKATCAGRQTMSRRDREKAARASATAARPSKASKLQAIVDAWDAWSPDSWSNQEKWIQGCNAVEAAIEAARTDVPNARTEANWLVEGLRERLSRLEQVVNPGGGEFANIATERNDNSGTDSWFVCPKCNEIIDGTDDLTDDKANGFDFKCQCGQEYIGVTHIMLHALEAARAEIRGGK